MTNGNVSITITDKDCEVRSPYHPDFVSHARSLNGKWNTSFWKFDARDEQRVRDICTQIYGTDGAEVPTFDVQIDLEKYRLGTNPCYGMGRLICERRSRDYSVKLGEGVVVIKGGFPSSGGSVKNPMCCADDGTILEIRDVPATIVRKEMESKEGINILSQEPHHEPSHSLSDMISSLTDDDLRELRHLIDERLKS